MRLLATTTALSVLWLTTSASASFQFTMSEPTVNTSVAKSTLAMTHSSAPARPTIFSLTNVGDSVTLDLFNLSVAGSGTGQVAVDFHFSQPVLSPAGVAKGGGFVGSISNGSITWNNPANLNFGANSDGILEISLSNGTVSSGPIQGTFTLRAEPTSGVTTNVVPEPGALAIWSLLGVVGLLFTAGRKHLQST